MTQRDRIVVGVLVTAVTLAAFFFLALKPKREEASKLSGEISKQAERLTAAEQRVAAGESARKRFADDYATVARLGKAVPVGDQTPSLLYQIESQADRNAVDFRTLKLRGGGGASTTTTSSPTAPPSGGQAGSGKPSVPTATQAAAATAPPGSVVGSAGFPTMPFDLKFDGTFFRMERFLSSLERFTRTTGSDGDVLVNGRLLTIDGFSISESKMSGFPEVNASIAATAYVLPPDEGATAGATPGGPTGGTSAAPGATASSGSGAPAPRTPTATAGGIVP